MKKITFFFIFQFIFIFTLFSQSDTLIISDIEAVTVSAPKISTEINKIPLSVTKYQISTIQASQPQISLQEYINAVPGLFSLNANNYAQDLRVSIRGFGARSAFGIRGIKLIVDGIPETTPDGQGQVDNLNLPILKNIEILRGPASAMYGNASGGVMMINTIDDFEKNFLKAGVTIGAFNLQQYNLTAGLKTKNTTYILHGNRSSADGYRDHSSFENNNFNARIFRRLSEKSKLNLLVNYADSPLAEDPGSLDSMMVKENREQAHSQNVLFNAGEEISQLKVGLNYKYEFDKNNLFNTYAFFSNRNFYGRLPFESGGIVDLSREFLGLGGNYLLVLPLKNGINKIQAGYDLATQTDNRLRYNNLNGTQDSLTYDQLEVFTNAGGYLVNHYSSGNWLISAGIRFDWNHLDAVDRIKENGNSSGERTLRTWNPSFGVSYKTDQRQYIYANFSTSFETPSLTELSANPSGKENFNPLDPQRAKNYELGIKVNTNPKIKYEFVLFLIDTKDELVPFELDTFPGRIFYRNTGKGSRSGLEFSFNYQMNKNWNLSFNYTYSDFIYDEYVLNDTLGINFNGNNLPGIPENYGAISISYLSENGLHARLQGRYIDEIFTNDANDNFDDSYFLLNLNMGYAINTSKIKITPFFGINNILDTEYNDNIRINAFGRRHFEPGPGLNIYGGVRFLLE